jgi:hypothetical protein
VDVDVLQEGSGTRRFFEVFLSGPEIGMRPKRSIILPLRWHKAVAPKQDLMRETGQLGTGTRVDKVTGSGDDKITAEILVTRSRYDPARLDPGREPRGGEMKVEVRELNHPLDRIFGWRRPRPAKSERLAPAHRIGQRGIIVVGPGIAAGTGDRQLGDNWSACEQMDRGRPRFERHGGRVKGRCGSADDRDLLAP